jgi:hypothetical protein
VPALDHGTDTDCAAVEGLDPHGLTARTLKV